MRGAGIYLADGAGESGGGQRSDGDEDGGELHVVRRVLVRMCSLPFHQNPAHLLYVNATGATSRSNHVGGLGLPQKAEDSSCSMSMAFPTCIWNTVGHILIPLHRA